MAAQGIRVIGSLYMQQVRVTGEVNIVGAKIGGELLCGGSDFENPDKEKCALNASGIHVAGAVYFMRNFHAKGEVSLVGAKIGGQLACSGGTFENPGGVALNADGIRVKGSVVIGTRRSPPFANFG